MNFEEFIKQLTNVTESKISVKLERNSRGVNGTVHVYAGVTKKEMDETVKNAQYALEEALKPYNVA